MKKILALVLLFAFVTGCSTQRFVVNPQAKNTAVLKMEKDSTHYFGSGGNEDIIKAAELCGGAKNVAYVETENTVGNVLVAVFTLGIVDSYKYRVYCKS